MKLTVREDSKNYAAIVVKIDNLHDIEGADNIVRTVVNGNNIIVSKAVKVGDIMLYFCSGIELSPDYCKNNNLYDVPEENLDTSKRGFISFKKRRVKAIKLKGIISDGMLMPIESLINIVKWSTTNTLKVGDEFTDINGINICKKYFIPIRNSNPGGKAPKQPKRISRLIDGQFYFHTDTSDLRRNIHKLNPDDIIGIHYKKHGCSCIVGNVLVKKNLKWYEKLAKFLGIPVVDTEYDIVYSSRKVIKNQYLNTESGGGFYGEDIWGVVAKEVGHLIPKNWTLYGEILGYTPSGSYIQDKFDYGCKQGEHKFYVYKISVVNPDGKVIYLTDKQIEEWCEKVGLLYKDTFLYYGKAINRFNYNINHEWDIQIWREKFLEMLESTYNEKDCYMCINKVPEEGIVLRIEHLEEYEAYKLKSQRFKLWENFQIEKELSNLEDEN